VLLDLEGAAAADGAAAASEAGTAEEAAAGIVEPLSSLLMGGCGVCWICCGLGGRGNFFGVCCRVWLAGWIQPSQTLPT
jgi:hypothetical protein